MRSYDLPHQTFRLLVNLATTHRYPEATLELRNQFRTTIRNEMRLAKFVRDEHTEWAFWRVETILEDGWQSAKSYFRLKPNFKAEEKNIGCILNRLIAGCRSDANQAKHRNARWLYEDDTGQLAAFIVYVTTERSRVVA